ncbi:MAG: prolyl oligopeptidase family serine peptidase [Acidimicrobiales bacterium]
MLHRTQRAVYLVATLALALAITAMAAIPAQASSAPLGGSAATPLSGGPLSNPPGPVLHNQFVPNVPLGRLRLTPTANVLPAPKAINGTMSGWSSGLVPTDLGGTTVVQAGQLDYQGWLLDDSGAAPTCEVNYYNSLQPAANALGWDRYQLLQSALGDEIIPDLGLPSAYSSSSLGCDKGVDNFGGASYPGSATPGSADLLQFRMAADSTNVYFLVRFDAMTPTDQPVAAIAIDTNQNGPTAAGQWGFDSGVATPGANRVVTLTRNAAYVNGQSVPGAQVASAAGTPNGFGGLIEASIPRSDIAPTTNWRMWVGTGLWDPTSGTWQAPVMADPGPRVFDLGFRGGVEPFTPYMNMAQAFALREGWNGSVSVLGRAFSKTVNVSALAAGENERWQIGPGYYIRDFMSGVTDGQHHGHLPTGSPQAEDISARQPYGFYVPTNYDPNRPTPMTVWLHWRGPGQENSAFFISNMIWQLGQERGSIVISPRGRGQAGWYVGDSQVDVFGAMANAEQFLNVDSSRVYLGGYSMGGWGTYLLAMEYPDLWAGAFVIAGPPVLGAWAYPLTPDQSGTGGSNSRPGYVTNPLVANARHVPFVIFQGTSDELVPVTGAVAQSNTFLANRQPYRFYLFDGYEHFSFAVMDEFAYGANYLGGRQRAVDPAHVSFTRLPCLDPVNWSPSYQLVANQAYWVSEVHVRDALHGAACTSSSTPSSALNQTGTVDVTSDALARSVDAGNPVASTGVAPDASGIYQMLGYQPKVGAPLPWANTLTATATNISGFTVDGARAGLRDNKPVVIDVSTDGPTTIALQALPGLAGGTVLIDGKVVGPFSGSVLVPQGQHIVTVQPA